MSILWYLGVCFVFFGGSILLHQRSQLQALKKEMARAEQPAPIKRNFRCHTI